MANTSVYGIYRTRQQAEQGVDRLLAAGFRNEDISVMLQDNVGTKDFAHEKHTKAPEGTATGAAAGASAGERRVYRGSRAEYVGERPGYRVRTCWRNDFGERVCRYRSRY